MAVMFNVSGIIISIIITTKRTTGRWISHNADCGLYQVMLFVGAICSRSQAALGHAINEQCFDENEDDFLLNQLDVGGGINNCIVNAGEFLLMACLKVLKGNPFVSHLQSTQSMLSEKKTLTKVCCCYYFEFLLGYWCCY